MSLKSDIIRRLASHPRTLNNIHSVLDRIAGGSFSRADALKVAVYYESDRISFSEIYPFLHYAGEFKRRFNAEFRFRNIRKIFADPASAAGEAADVVILQAWFTTEEGLLARTLEAVRYQHKTARIAFLDAMAPADLRLARIVDDYVDFYLKKSVLRDESLYYHALRGDTNLEDYYGRLYGLEVEPVDWGVPDGFLKKLRLAPNFFTAPALINGFERGGAPEAAGRTLDVHARLGEGNGGGWYNTMRQASLGALEGLGGFRVVSGFGVSQQVFMEELRRSKFCFSPFGYGELCWRDIEAILCGSLLVKPDMSHLRMEPDIYLPGETYAPVKWDFSDLVEILENWRNDEEKRASTARRAFDLIADYLRENHFVDQMSFLMAG